MNNPIKKYYIGVIVLAVLSVALLGYILVSSSAYREDVKVNKAAVEIAKDLEIYIRDEGKLPNKLSDATKKDIPSQVTYDKVSNKKYNFCITYKSENTGGQIVANPTDFISSSLYGGAYQYNYDSGFGDGEQQYLFVDTFSWDKGEICSQITPYELNFGSRSSNSYEDDTKLEDFPSFGDTEQDLYMTEPDDSLDFLCDPNYEFYDLYAQDCDSGMYRPNLDQL